MNLIFYIFAAILIYFSLRSFLGGIEYLRFFKREVSKPLPDHSQFVTVIAPCKGLDEGIEENLRALLDQDHISYEIIFVVDDENDPAVPTIENILSASPSLCGENKLVIAPKAANSGQKVENLREAVLHADARSGVFAFVDSDVRPAPEWLRHLVAPLNEANVGAATGYRWFISERASFASELRSAWNASIASVLGPDTNSNFSWGGSTAMRRDVFERLDMRERWRGTLSDDFAVTRVIKEAGMQIRFVPFALTRSHGDCALHECLEFTTRQMKLTRVYQPHLWLLSFFGSGLFTVVMLLSFLIVLLSRQNSLLVWAAIATLVLVSLFSIAKAWLRLAAVRMVIPEVRKQTFAQLTLWLLAPPLFFYNCICALLSRRMRWRGVTYELVSEKETLRIE